MINSICLTIAKFFLRRMTFRCQTNRNLFNQRYDAISRLQGNV